MLVAHDFWRFTPSGLRHFLSAHDLNLFFISSVEGQLFFILFTLHEMLRRSTSYFLRLVGLPFAIFVYVVAKFVLKPLEPPSAFSAGYLIVAKKQF